MLLPPAGLVQNEVMFLIFILINEEAPLQLLSSQRLGVPQEWLHYGDSTAFLFRF